MEKQLVLIIVGALIFIASFLWKDFLKELEEKIFPQEAGLFYRFIYTLILSVGLIYLAVYLRERYRIANVPALDSNPSNNNNLDQD